MKIHFKPLVVAVLLLVILSISSKTKAQTVSNGKKISTDLLGLFFEDINYSADGGLYAELVQNRSFEYNPTERKEWTPFSFWEYVTPGYSYGKVSVETNSPVHPNNPHYMVLDIEHVGKEAVYTGVSGVGLKNTGFDGIVVRSGEKYNFCMFAWQMSEKPLNLLISLQNTKGEVLAQNTVVTNAKNWQKYEAVLTASASCDTASLVILAQTEGRVAFDMVSLFPEKTFKNRKNGLRADLAQLLAEMKPRFVRFPGGCLVHGDGLENMYRWKNTIGPVEQRKAQRNIWGYHQTSGLGYFEYFQFCEDIGAKPLPVLPAAVSCQNSGNTWPIGGTGQRALPIDELNEYIQEVLDLIEWANADANTTWGAKRAAAGHPKPFNLEYVGIGNEDKMSPAFEERFNLIYTAVKAKHPEITVVGTVGPAPSGEDFEIGWKIANKLKVPIVDEHYYMQADWFLHNQYRYDSYPRTASKVYLGEYASWGNKMHNAIAEAAYLTGIERNGDIVQMASYAPLLAKKGFTQWTTDLIFFDNTTLCPTPNYFVQKLFMTNQGDRYFDGIVQKADRDSTLAASCVVESSTGDLILKLVNASIEPKTVKIDLSKFKNLREKARISVLVGKAEAMNTFDAPKTIRPTESDLKISKKMDYSTPAMSLTVIRVKMKK